MTDYRELIARVRSPFALTERDAQEIADALEAHAKEIVELEKSVKDAIKEVSYWSTEAGKRDARLAELEAELSACQRGNDSYHDQSILEHNRAVDMKLRIEELEAVLKPLAFRKEIELTLENGAHSVKAIVIFDAEREAAIKLLKGANG